MASESPSRRAKAHRAKASRVKTSRGRPTAKTSSPSKSSREKVRAYRERMRAKGLRLVQIWLPDTRTAEFAKEARRQSLLANRSPFAGKDQTWVDSMSNWKID